jgi:hypothetical protein
MSTHLDPVRSALRATAAIDVGALDRTELGELVLGLRRLLDSFEGEYARLVHHADVDRVWADGGATSLAMWISNGTGTAPGRAKRAAKLGEALEKSTDLAEAVRAGAVAADTAHEIAAAVDDEGFAEAAPQLIGELAGATPRQAERTVDAWRQINDPDAARQRTRQAFERRCLTFTPIGDGLERVEGIVPTHVGRALRAALHHIVEEQVHDGSGRVHSQRMVDALGDLAAAYSRGKVTGGRNLPRVIVSITLETLEQRAGVGHAADGGVMSADEIQRLCCDAHLHPYLTDQEGAVLQFGRGRRTASPHQYLAMVERDRGCRFPGCDRPPGWCEAHHLNEFSARGGLTDLDQMALLCHTHHHLVHEGGWTMSGSVTGLTFVDPTGTELHAPLPGRLALNAA